MLSLLYTGSALATTAIGTLIPILSDSGELKTRFGTYLLAAGAVGEFGPIMLLTLGLTTSSPLHEAAILVAFVALAVGVAVLAVRSSGRTIPLLERTLETSSQLAVRWIVVLVFTLALLASDLGLDLLLGGFAAGLITREILRDREVGVFDSKLTAVAFGFFVPFFFVVSGMSLDVDALFGSAAGVLKMFLFFGLFLLVRGAPALLLYRRTLAARERLALAFFTATQLPLVLAITTVAVDAGEMRTSTAAALVGAAVLSTLIYPMVGLRLRARRPPSRRRPRSSRRSRSDARKRRRAATQPRPRRAGPLRPGAVIESWLAEHVEDAPGGARLRVGRRVDDPGNAGEDDRAGAHRAGLQRHIDRRIRNPPPAEPPRRGSEREDLRVSRRVGAQLALVAGGREDLVGPSDHRPDRCLAAGARDLGLVEGEPHQLAIQLGTGGCGHGPKYRPPATSIRPRCLRDGVRPPGPAPETCARRDSDSQPPAPPSCWRSVPCRRTRSALRDHRVRCPPVRRTAARLRTAPTSPARSWSAFAAADPPSSSFRPRPR